MSNLSILFLSRDDVVACGAEVMEDVLQDMETVFRLHHKGDCVLPDKTVLRWGDAESELEKGRINAMPGYVGGKVNIAGIKWIGSGPRNTHQYRLPRASALIVLNDPHTMVPIAVMDGTVISAMRTGGVTGLAVKYLANHDASTVGIIGAGVQSHTQLAALKAALPKLSKVNVYSLSKESRQRFAKVSSNTLGIEVIAVPSARQAVAKADIVVTATTAKEPVVKADWFGDGCFYSHVGGHEAEYSVIEKADKIVVDNWQAIKSRGAQTLALMYAEKRFHPKNIYAELGEIVIGCKEGREHEREFVYFTAVGMATEDLIIAKRIYDNAKRKGRGRMLKLWDSQST